MPVKHKTRTTKPEDGQFTHIRRPRSKYHHLLMLARTLRLQCKKSCYVLLFGDYGRKLFLEDLSLHCDLDLEDRNPTFSYDTPGSWWCTIIPSSVAYSSVVQKRGWGGGGGGEGEGEGGSQLGWWLTSKKKKNMWSFPDFLLSFFSLGTPVCSPSL